MFPKQTIYAITDPGLSRLSHREQVERLLDGGARLIQLRDKNLAPEALVAMARTCTDLCRRAGATLILNDHPKAAVLAGAHGVHIGQDDMDPVRVREIVGPDRIIGLSTHNRQQFERALELPVNYIAVGPVFGTTTKADPDPATGTALVEYAWSRLQGRKPLVAIGGISRERLSELVRSAPGVYPAVIGAVMKAPDIGQAWKDLEQTLGRIARTPLERAVNSDPLSGACGPNEGIDGGAGDAGRDP